MIAAARSVLTKGGNGNEGGTATQCGLILLDSAIVRREGAFPPEGTQENGKTLMWFSAEIKLWWNITSGTHVCKGSALGFVSELHIASSFLQRKIGTKIIERTEKAIISF